MKSLGTGFQRGVVLVQVLLVLTILALLASNVQFEQRRDVDRTLNYLRSGQGWQYLLSGEALARQGLKLDLDNSEVDDLAELWNMPAGPFPLGTGREGELEAGSITLQMHDVERKFNLNWLSDEGQNPDLWRDRFRRVLNHLNIDQQIANNVREWMQKDSGAEYQYQMLESPYMPAARPMVHVSELLLVKGVTPEIFDQLRPYVSALNPSSKLNINTAPLAVLYALTDELDSSVIEQMIDARDDESFTSVDEAASRLSLTAKERNAFSSDRLGVNSEYFELFSEVTLGEQVMHLTSLIRRSQDGSMQLLSRDQVAREAFNPVEPSETDFGTDS